MSEGMYEGVSEGVWKGLEQSYCSPPVNVDPNAKSLASATKAPTDTPPLPLLLAPGTCGKPINRIASAPSGRVALLESSAASDSSRRGSTCLPGSLERYTNTCRGRVRDRGEDRNRGKDRGRGVGTGGGVRDRWWDRGVVDSGCVDRAPIRLCTLCLSIAGRESTHRQDVEQGPGSHLRDRVCVRVRSVVSSGCVDKVCIAGRESTHRQNIEQGPGSHPLSSSTHQTQTLRGRLR